MPGHLGQASQAQASQTSQASLDEAGQAILVQAAQVQALGPGHLGHTSQAIQAKLVRPCTVGQATQAQVSFKTSARL